MDKVTLQSTPQDTITLQLKAEEFITSDTVKVIVSAKVMLQEKAVNARHQILTELRNVIDTDWRFSSVSRTEDTGMERIEAIAYTRVQEKDVANVTVRAKQARRQGLEIVLADVQYTPPKKQIEETIEKLRKLIYEKAQKEADSVNSLTSGWKWRVGDVAFVNVPEHAERLYSSNAMRGVTGPMGSTGPAGDEGEDGQMDVTQRVAVSAIVKIVRAAPHEVEPR